ncbi:hypothetical protein ACIBUY_23625 [Streptomyces sp. NPDC050085]|uniref:hypothetical protein n=1 Tax=Streptomyces sp. NPDC050085 TaxID=3365600 RepID=UPI0037A55130
MGSSEQGVLIGRDGGRDEPALPNGNAPYASLRPRPGDRALKLLCRAVPPLWAALGWRTAADAFGHYLRGTGTPFALDAHALLAVPVVRDAVDAQLAHWREEARTLPPGTYPADSGWRGVLITRSASRDLWLALRGVQFRVVGSAEVGPDGTVRTPYRFSVHKTWNFDRGESEYGIPFTPFARLHETGLAREFTAEGETDGPVGPGAGPR